MEYSKLCPRRDFNVTSKMMLTKDKDEIKINIEGTPCIKQRCAWYDCSMEMCAVLVLAVK